MGPSSLPLNFNTLTLKDRNKNFLYFSLLSMHEWVSFLVSNQSFIFHLILLVLQIIFLSLALHWLPVRWAISFYFCAVLEQRPHKIRLYLINRCVTVYFPTTHFIYTSALLKIVPTQILCHINWIWIVVSIEIFKVFQYDSINWFKSEK